ncbi:unnamed protein product [Diatraea saccharalis]|uniref:C2H2-type domain-containing protein n=1 Tax=Diatraea saccharalis TaxID=40085 RepID=A0A9P0G045_9NEOP|nr:unnamed protein product [Diatraea saccharalis]
MNGDNNVLCCACLCGDRKMVRLEGVSMKRCFLEIVNEMPSEIKPEILDTVEENNLSSHSDNFDDDTKLIEYSNRKKKKKLKVRKKRKEKNDETDVIKEIELTMQELTEERRMLVEREDEKQDARESFPCEFCDKIFRWKTSLRKHIEMHRIETGQKRKPYCEPCRLSFSTTFNLQKHTRTSSKHKIQLKLW